MLPKEKEHIEQFVAIVEKVKMSKFRRELNTVRLQLNFEGGKPINQQITGYDEDDFRSMLMDLRKLLLKQDDVRITDICDLIIKNTSDSAIIQNVEDCKTAYSDLMKDPQIKMIINGTPETVSKIVKNWLYGHYIHEKKKQQDALLQIGEIGIEIHRFNFVIAMAGLINLSAVVANNAKLAFGL